MNYLSNTVKIVSRSKKRKGRGLGSGIGAKSGRGTTRHQKARESIPLHFEGGQGRMVKRFPLLRGKARNKSINPEPLVITLDLLNKLESDKVIDLDFLVNNKLVEPEARIRGVKVLSNGELTKKIQVKLPVSKSAREKIEKAGGQVVAL